jgi:hypothetical protein
MQITTTYSAELMALVDALLEDVALDPEVAY